MTDVASAFQTSAVRHGTVITFIELETIDYVSWMVFAVGRSVVLLFRMLLIVVLWKVRRRDTQRPPDWA